MESITWLVDKNPHAKLDSSMSPSTPEEIQIMSSKPCNKAIGCLTYAAVCTRPDISFAVAALRWPPVSARILARLIEPPSSEFYHT